MFIAATQTSDGTSPLSPNKYTIITLNTVP